MQKSDFTFFHPLRVRFAECDMQGIVFNVNYYLFFDVAITEYMREQGFAFAGPDALEMYTVSSRCDYRDSALFDDMLDIGVRCARIGRSSVDFAFGVFRDGELLTEGSITYVHAVRGTKTSTPLPAPFIETILAFEKTAPMRS